MHMQIKGRLRIIWKKILWQTILAQHLNILYDYYLSVYNSLLVTIDIYLIYP